MDGPWIAVVLLVFLAVMMATASSGMARTRRRARAAPPVSPVVRVDEDTFPDDIADETTPSRSDD